MNRGKDGRKAITVWRRFFSGGRGMCKRCRDRNVGVRHIGISFWTVTPLRSILSRSFFLKNSYICELT